MRIISHCKSTFMSDARRRYGNSFANELVNIGAPIDTKELAVTLDRMSPVHGIVIVQ